MGHHLKGTQDLLTMLSHFKKILSVGEEKELNLETSIKMCSGAELIATVWEKKGQQKKG